MGLDPRFDSDAAGLHPGSSPSVPVVLFTLMAERTDDHPVVDDLEKQHVTSATEGHDQLVGTTVAQLRPTA